MKRAIDLCLRSEVHKHLVVNRATQGCDRDGGQLVLGHSNVAVEELGFKDWHLRNESKTE